MRQSAGRTTTLAGDNAGCYTYRPRRPLHVGIIHCLLLNIPNNDILPNLGRVADTRRLEDGTVGSFERNQAR